MRAWLAETIYWITFIVVKQITFPHFWITFGGKLIFLLFLLLCHERYYRNYILWFTYLFSLFPPRIKSWPWTGSGRVFSGSGSWPKYGAGFVKTWDILTGTGFYSYHSLPADVLWGSFVTHSFLPHGEREKWMRGEWTPKDVCGEATATREAGFAKI